MVVKIGVLVTDPAARSAASRSVTLASIKSRGVPDYEPRCVLHSRGCRKGKLARLLVVPGLAAAR